MNIFREYFLKLAFFLVLLFGIAACMPVTEKWKEEVLLSDGRIIVIERELVLESGGDEWAFNRSGSKPKEYRLRFPHPDKPDTSIEWHSIKKDIATWPEIPMVLDIASNQLVIVSAVYEPKGCLVYNKYLYKKDSWEEERLPPTFIQRQTNLFIFREEDFKQYIDVKTKLNIINKHNSSDRSDRYDQVGPQNPNCKGA